MILRQPGYTLFPYTTLFRSVLARGDRDVGLLLDAFEDGCEDAGEARLYAGLSPKRSEEHTSELQSRRDLVCRLLLEKKKKKNKNQHLTTIHYDFHILHVHSL